MSKLLDKYWRVTAKAPRRYPGSSVEGGYETGLDVLGASVATKALVVQKAATAVTKATPTATSTATKTVAKATKVAPHALVSAVAKGAAKPVETLRKAATAKGMASAGKRALAVGRRLMRRHPRMGRKLVALGNRFVQKSTMIKGLVPTEALATSAQAIIDSMNAVALVGEVADSVDPIRQQLVSANLIDLANVGQNLIDRSQAVVDAFDPDNVDVSVASTVYGIQSDANAWKAQAQSALSGVPTAPGAFDAGTPGGGGGGGGDEGEGEGEGAPSGAEATPSDEEAPEDTTSEAVQRFRESGGEWDPFADEEGGETPEDVPEGEGEVPSYMLDYISEEEEVEMPEDLEAKKELLEEDMMGYEFQWYDFFDPVGGGIRYALSTPGKDITPGVKKPVAAGKPSPEVASRLAASKQKLAALQAQLIQAHATSPVAPSPSSGVASAPMDFSQRLAESQRKYGISVLENQEQEAVEGEDMDEAEDIFFSQHQIQITDDPPDPIRRRGSVHRGAGYLQAIDYPPWGASAGQEGGMIRPEERIEVFGGDSYVCGLDVLGCGYCKKGAR